MDSRWENIEIPLDKRSKSSGKEYLINNGFSDCERKCGHFVPNPRILLIICQVIPKKESDY